MSRRQATRAFSSGEAEFYAGSTTGIELLGSESLMKDLGWTIDCKRVLTDSDACRGMASRQGLGRTRHLDTKRLWLQEAVESRGLVLGRIAGIADPSDPMTKPVSYQNAL